MLVFDLDQFITISWPSKHVSLPTGTVWQGLRMRDQKVKLLGESVVQNKVRMLHGYWPHWQNNYPAASIPSFHTICVSQSANTAIVPMQLFVGPERELTQWNNSGQKRSVETELLKSGLNGLIYSVASQMVAWTAERALKDTIINFLSQFMVPCLVNPDTCTAD